MKKLLKSLLSAKKIVIDDCSSGDQGKCISLTKASGGYAVRVYDNMADSITHLSVSAKKAKKLVLKYLLLEGRYGRAKYGVYL